MLEGLGFGAGLEVTFLGAVVAARGSGCSNGLGLGLSNAEVGQTDLVSEPETRLGHQEIGETLVFPVRSDHVMDP